VVLELIVGYQTTDNHFSVQRRRMDRKCQEFVMW